MLQLKILSVGFYFATMRFACCSALSFAIASIVHAHFAFGQDKGLLIEPNKIVVEAVLKNRNPIVLQPAKGQADEVNKAKGQVFKMMRGIIQNELALAGSTSELDVKQTQLLVDLAENDWKSKTTASVIKCTQQHVYGTIDLDSLAERVVRGWLATIASPDQLARYDLELADRMRYKKKALICKLLETLEKKLNLSSSQMTQIEVVLNTKWNDRWYRSLEATFNNSSLLPEIRPAWISSILFEAQRAALVTRDIHPSFGAQQISHDSPSMDLEERFQIREIASSDSIPLVPVPVRNAQQDQIEAALKETKD